MKTKEINSLLQRVQERTFRRVLNLNIEIENHKPKGELPILKLQGESKTYHTKQLAQEAVKDLAGKYLIENQIAVEQ